MIFVVIVLSNLCQASSLCLSHYFFLLLGSFLLLADASDVNDQKQYADDQEHKRGQRAEFGANAALRGFGKQKHRKVRFRSANEVADGEVVKAEREGEYQTGYDARHNVRYHYLCQRLNGRAAEIHRRLIERVAALTELRHNREDNVGDVEGNVRDDQP